MPKICASDSNVFVVYKAVRTWYGAYLQRSTDYGETWQPTQRLYYTAGENYGEHPVVASKDSMAYVAVDIRVNYVPPNQNWDTWLFRSHDCGVSWPDTFFVSDSTSSGLGPDLAVNNYSLHFIRGLGLPSSSVMEVIYNGSSDEGESWFGPIMISDNDTSGSFWPQISAWGDSNVIVSWTDYKDSHEEWSGDAFVSRSTDNGHSWSAPYQLTHTHGVQGTDIYATNDTILFCYDDARDGTSAIYATISLDGGLTWQDDQRVSDSPYYCIESSVGISNGAAHISWSDSRNSPQDPGLFDIYYDRNNLSTGIEEEDRPPKPDRIILGAYPNPFNSTCMITYNLQNEKGGELSIYNIQGQKIRGFNLTGKEGKIVWDAKDAKGNKICSGIYFARASTPPTEKIIKLILLR